MDALIFLSYSSSDKLIADAICSRLENQGVRCWIAPRDVNPGADYSNQISDALERSTAMVMIFSSGSNNSRHVKSEIDRAFSLNKVIIPFRVENVEMDKGLAYYLSKTHWLDALTKPLDQHIDRLAETIRKVSGIDGPPPLPLVQSPVIAVAPPSKSKAPWVVAGIAVIVCGFVLVAGLLFAWFSRRHETAGVSVSPTPNPTVQSAPAPSTKPATVPETAEKAATTPAPNPEKFVGTWKITEATTIEGVPYDGTVEIKSSGPRYKVKWNLAANPINGLALPLGNKLCAGYSDGDFSVVVYEIGADGSLKGRWAHSSFSANDRDGLENVTGGTPGKIEGDHVVKGLNPDGTSYEGSLRITKTDQTYELQWEILGRSPKGMGIKVDNVLFVTSVYEGTFGVASYTFEGSRAKGVWTTSGESKLGTENLAK